MWTALLLALWAVKTPVEPLIFAHTPEWLLSSAKPETQLMGITVDVDLLADVEKRFGRPAEVKRDPRYPGEATYRWNKDDLKLEVGTMFPDPSPGPAGEHVISVTVRGSRSTPTAKTRGGVRLGDTFETLIAKYGKGYQLGYQARRPQNTTAVLFVFSNDTRLTAELDNEGKIVGLELAASEE